MTDDEIREGLRAVDLFVKTGMPGDEADLCRRGILVWLEFPGLGDRVSA